MALLNSRVLKKETCREIESLGPMAEQIADRWAGGWPKMTQEMEANGSLLPAVKDQLAKEVELEATHARDYRHLAHHEFLEMMGASMAPPGVTASR